MKRSDLHDYQSDAVAWMNDRERGFLWLKMGDGKTVIAASAVLDAGVPAVVVGTKRIIENVWPAELKRWEHLSSLSYSAVVGPLRDRQKAVSSKPDILGISYENLLWYLDQTDPVARPFWIYDEVSKMKSHATRRFRAVHAKKKPAKCFGLTATPTMEGHLGLWAQWKTIGGDDRLGRTITEFRKLYTIAQFKGMFTEYVITKTHAARIERLLAPDVFTIPDSRRPYTGTATVIDVPIGWTTAGSREHYTRMEKDLIAELEKTSFAAASKGVAMNKCRQIATGFIYDEKHDSHVIDQEKIDAVAEAVDELGGDPVLVFYQFEHERDALLEAIPGSEPLEGHNYELFNAGKIPALVLHPRSCSHGLNLQGARYAFFSSLPWSGEEYWQAVGRIVRQGQTREPVVKRFLRENSIDGDVAATVDGKISDQQALIERIRERAG